MRATTYPRNNLQSMVEQLLVAALLGLVLFFVLLIGGLLGFQLWHAGSIYSGVRVAGIEVGGLTREAAAAKVTASFNFPQNGRILFRDGGQTWLVTPAEMGLFFDPDTTIKRAYAVGRSGGLITRLSQQFETGYYGVDVSPAFLYDQRLAYQYLAALASQINKPTIEASLSLQNTEVVVRSGETGRSLDVDSTLALLSTQMQSLRDGIIPLVIKETPPVVLDASKEAESARKILSQPFTLTLPDGQPDQKGPWLIKPEMLAGLLSIERVSNGGGSGSYKVGLNASLLRTYLSDLAPKLDVYPQNARFVFNDDTKKIEPIEKSVTGRTLDVEATIKAIQEAAAAGKHNTVLVFQFNQPAVPDTATGKELGITELIETQTSYFYGSSAPRIQNIQAAASRFHGLLVAPGETFSMVNALGDITLDNGYAEALIIVGNKTIQGVGGGVCQVSTTLFRTAFFAGFPIVERNPHAYRVYYYEKIAGNVVDSNLAGLDATVFVPLVDFKFRNDTPYWLLMETYVNPKTSNITWKFYSTSDGRKVDWQTTGPTNIQPPPPPEYHENPDLPKGEIKQVDWAAEGADVTVNRTVTKDGSVYLQDTFSTRYQAWADKYDYGPGTEVPTPEPGQ